MRALSVFVAATAIAAISPSHAQQDPPGAALVKELLDLSGARRQHEQVMRIMIDSMRSGFDRALSDAMRRAPVAPEKRAQAEAVLARHAQAVFDEMAAVVGAVMPFDKLVADIYVPLFSRSYSAREMEAVIAFYKTPAGRKFADTSPRLMQKAATMVNQRYGGELQQRISAQVERRMQQAIAELKSL